MQEIRCYGNMSHNYHHVTRSDETSGMGYAQDVYLYCTQCGDIIEITNEEEA